LKKLLTNKVNRGGYADDATQNAFAEIELSEFILSADPHEYLSSFNRIKVDEKGKEMIKDLKPPSDLEQICEDLKCCGRREFSELLKLRYKYNVAIDRARKSEKEAKKAQEGQKEMTQEELEALVDKELEDTIKRVEKEKKRALKKERVAAAKQDIAKKMSVIAATTINNDEDLLLDSKTWDKLK
jgi:hypothetical protein